MTAISSDYISQLQTQLENINDCHSLDLFQQQIENYFQTLISQSQSVIDDLGGLVIDPSSLTNIGAVVGWITKMIEKFRNQMIQSQNLNIELVQTFQTLISLINSKNSTLNCELPSLTTPSVPTFPELPPFPES